MLKSYLLLEGGAEFGGRMAEPDRRAIELAGGLDAAIAILPTAAAPDNNHQRAGDNGRRWFRSLGARQVQVLPLIDRASAGDPGVVAALRGMQLIYLLGGFPGYLERTLEGSESWSAIQEAYARGAVVGGSSAGAMVLCGYYYDPYEGKLSAGLGLVSGVCVLPHYNTAGRKWVDGISKDLPGVTLVGIDESTGAINDGPDGAWTVYGAGSVTQIKSGQQSVYSSGEIFSLP